MITLSKMQSPDNPKTWVFGYHTAEGFAFIQLRGQVYVHDNLEEDDAEERRVFLEKCINAPQNQPPNNPEPIA